MTAKPSPLLGATVSSDRTTFPLRIQCRRGVSYAAALAWQMTHVAALRQQPDTTPDGLWFIEHEPVITLGRSDKGESLRVSADALAEKGVALHAARRGGEATWHGLGQWTVYPVLRLERWGKNLHTYLRQLEEVVIRYLAAKGIASERVPDKTGVWVTGDKIAAVGVGVTRWISFHGFAINIQPDLSAFTDLIIPCGIAPAEGGVTSLAKITASRHDPHDQRECFDMQKEQAAIQAAFLEVFPYTLIKTEE